MNKPLLLSLLCSIPFMPMHADNIEEESTAASAATTTEEFMSDERLEEGFLTHYLNSSVARGLSGSQASA